VGVFQKTKPKISKPRKNMLGSRKKRWTQAERTSIRKFYKDGNSYGKTMEEFNISSKGTLSHILNHQYADE
jgi:hypothetical protein